MSDIWSNAVQAHQEGNFSLAKQLYDQVLEDTKNAQDYESEVIVRYHLARLALEHEGKDVALHRFKKMLRVQEKMGDNAGISRTYREIAEICEQQGDLVEAIRAGEKALASAREIYEQQQMAASYHLLGVLYQYANLPSQALVAMREAQKHWEELGNVVAWQNSTMVYADILQEQENFALCIRELRRVLKTLDNKEDLEDMATIHFRVSTLFGREGDFRNALIHMLACLVRNQALQSDLMQRDASVIQDIRQRIGEPEFEVIVTKKLGEEGAGNLLAWLTELFPPEVSDAFLEQVPTSDAMEPPSVETQSLESQSSEFLSVDPSDETQEPEMLEGDSTLISARNKRPQPVQQHTPVYDEVPYLTDEALSQIGENENQFPSEDPWSKPSEQRHASPIPEPAQEPAQTWYERQDGIRFEDDDVMDAEKLHSAESAFFEDRGSEDGVGVKSVSTEKSKDTASRTPVALVNWDEEPESVEVTNTSNSVYTEDWTGQSQNTQRNFEVPISDVAQHFVAAFLGVMAMLAIVQWLL